uniref:Clathrin/coatomer adaptor adaptin-like N-terminal domain-containing protein n=1 Tax=Compsopogon caeruleus TaxID=31354 RepID=A0A7S1TDJ8_9RHOD|mmetsp:Transcript_15347/g.31130  ORF Transcript_15347/g.31130 Transcript_15347/m.31130 type:complete len:799 (+) Transcript_15347:614-3010(+)
MSVSVAVYTLFRESLQDLVKAIRSHRRNEGEFIRARLAEIQQECKRPEPMFKANAVLKLTYLHMFGCSVAPSSFHVVEVLSRPDFAQKRIGYLAAAQIFSPSTDVLLLCTNQFKKDLTSGKADCSQALTCLAKIVTEELGRECSGDVFSLLNSPRSYIRKKALLTMYKVSLVYPEAISPFLPRLQDRLEDSDPTVVCAAVTVICEMAKTEPKKFLGFAPALFALLERPTSNNWTQIKIVKLMGKLTPLEPRLAKKLREPMKILMKTTRAESLLYECCNTVTLGMIDYPDVVDLCAARLGEFIRGSDQNLKFLGLLSMERIARVSREALYDHREIILDCLDDRDVVIRMRALDLIAQFFSKRNLRELSKILLLKLQSPDALLSEFEFHFRDSVAERLLVAGAFNKSGEKGSYPNLTTPSDFDWYIESILFGLLRTPDLSSRIWDSASSQLLELTARVEVCRKSAVTCSLELMGEYSASRGRGTDVLKPEILSAPIWVLGEHASHLDDSVLALKRICELPLSTLAPSQCSRAVESSLKIFCSARENILLGMVRDSLVEWLASLSKHYDADVQEVASISKMIISPQGFVLEGLSSIVGQPLNPVDPRAQSKVPFPKGFDLDEALCAISDEDEFESTDLGNLRARCTDDWENSSPMTGFTYERDTPSNRTGDAADRKSHPFYLRETSPRPAYVTDSKDPQRAENIFGGMVPPGGASQEEVSIRLADDVVPDGAIFTDEEMPASKPKRRSKSKSRKGKARGNSTNKIAASGTSRTQSNEISASGAAGVDAKPLFTLTIDDLLG